jgi:hypothetical protein
MATAPNASQTSSDTSAPVSSTDSTSGSPRRRAAAPNANPPTNAAIKPLPCSATAEAYAHTARLSTAAPANPSAAQPRRRASLTSQPPVPPTTAPTPAHRQLRGGRARPDPRLVRRGPRARQRDQHKRSGDPVVEPALHVDQPADPGRDSRIEHHARAEGRIRRRQRRAYQQGKPDVHPAEQGQREQCSQADRQRQPHPQQPPAQAKVGPQVPQPDPEASENSTKTAAVLAVSSGLPGR